ncbi:uroporphyrinogen-III synthase [Brachybacterium sp. YJGR34]|uniref:uroporphyrinogen-III synthase n=1 Tax=Brachybacterium sp. YJGR34 TaxID=2059911 RepID=UPI000E0C0E52|nr:uroporphyrinogen-III synthase [Brachybacterium sp. YJGR34]
MSTSPQLSRTLDGRTLVLAVDRKAQELAAALERHGARVERAPAMSTIPHVDDPALLELTRELIARPPRMLIALTGVGFRGWMEAAEAAGLAEELRSALGETEILARGPKARGAVQQAGLTTAWVAASETAAEIGEHLAGRDLAGVRVAVQHHGSGADGLDDLLAAHGAEALSLTVYRWGPSPDPEALRRSVLRAADGEIDAVVFTSAPGAEGWLEDAESAGALEGIAAQAGTGRLLLAAVGPVTAGPLTGRELPVLIAERGRLGSLVRTVVQHYEESP